MDTQAGADLRQTRRASGEAPRARQMERPGAKNELIMQLGPGPDAAADARNALLALEPGLDETLLSDARLLVSELVTNSVRHSNAHACEPVRMSVEVTDANVRVEVADRGAGFEPQPRDDDRTRPGGWGLYLVDQLADRWGVVRDQLTRVWFELDRGRSRRLRDAAA